MKVKRYQALKRYSKGAIDISEDEYEKYRDIYRCDLENLEEGFKKFSDEYKIWLKYGPGDPDCRFFSKKYFRDQINSLKRQRKSLMKFFKKYFIILEDIRPIEIEI